MCVHDSRSLQLLRTGILMQIFQADNDEFILAEMLLFGELLNERRVNLVQLGPGDQLDQ